MTIQDDYDPEHVSSLAPKPAPARSRDEIVGCAWAMDFEKGSLDFWGMKSLIYARAFRTVKVIEQPDLKRYPSTLSIGVNTGYTWTEMRHVLCEV